MKKITIFALSTAFLLGSLNADYREGYSSPKSQHYQSQVQQTKKNAKNTSDCPACRAKAGKNYYRLMKPKQSS